MTLTQFLGKLPALTGTMGVPNFTKRLETIQNKNINCGFAVVEHKTDVLLVNDNYHSSVYSPTQNRIYLIPAGQAAETTWHYIDCDTGDYVPYIHGCTTVPLCFNGGGVYSPKQDRIYILPAFGDTPLWAYIDCKTGEVVEFAHGLPYVEELSYDEGTETYTGGYFTRNVAGGVYSPTQNRIYLILMMPPGVTTWYYIDCDDGSVVAYEHGMGDIFGLFQYSDGVYSPVQNRIYLIPLFPATLPATWHYIDCTTGNIVGYQHGLIHDFSPGDEPNWKGVYSPLQDRIYFLPQGPGAPINYIDCADNLVKELVYDPFTLPQYDWALDAEGQTVTTPWLSNFVNGTYSPATNRIYFSSDTCILVINCNDDSITVAPIKGTWLGGRLFSTTPYSPTDGRIYLVNRDATAPLSLEHKYIQEFSSADVSPQDTAISCLNKS